MKRNQPGLAIIVPGDGSLAFTAGGVAVASSAHGRAFVSRAVSLLGFESEAVETDHDPELSEEDNRILYNLRLFHFYLGQADRERVPIGVWG